MKISESPPKQKRKKVDRQAFNADYNRKNMVRKQMYFNKKVPEDVQLLEWVGHHRNFTKYIKDLIRADMARNGYSVSSDQTQIPISHLL